MPNLNNSFETSDLIFIQYCVSLLTVKMHEFKFIEDLIITPEKMTFKCGLADDYIFQLFEEWAIVDCEFIYTDEKNYCHIEVLNKDKVMK